MIRAYRVALFCGACPLVVGVTVFLLWLITHWDWLEMAGICTIGCGILLFIVGACSLIITHHTERTVYNVPRGKLWRSTLLCAGLLLSNFLAAAVIIATVDNILGITKYHGRLGQDESGEIKLAGWRVSKPQVLEFGATSFRLHNDGKISTISLHVQGHIDGAAVIYAPLNGLPHTISGDVDWRISGEYSDYSMILDYSPTGGTAGKLNFEVSFH